MNGSQKTRLILRISALCFLLADISHTWSLTSLNISDNAPIWKFAVWRNRAFLAIPRTANEVRGEDRPTLVEVAWPEINTNLLTAVANKVIVPFSKKRPKRDYETLVSVTGLDVDARGQLWILDSPDEYDLWPRIVIHDLRRNDRLVSSTELTGVSPRRLKTLVIDPFENQQESRGYIADAGDETIIVCSLVSGQSKWWKLRMSYGPEIPRVYLTDLAISRRDSILYMTGHDTHDLFSINLEQIRTEQASASHEIQNVTVTWHGKKLGSSIGLFCDSKDGLHYFMTSERASVRWDIKSPLNVEGHSIMIQNDDVPCITDYIMDARKNVWGLVNSKCPGITRPNTSDKSRLKFRTVKIPKHPLAL